MIKNTKKWSHYGLIAYALTIFIAINILAFSWLNKINLDITEEKRFSVSEHSLKIIQAIPERVDLKLYVSDVIFSQMPTMKNYVERVQDFLYQLEKDSAGKLTVTTTIIQPFSEEEDQAIALGLKSLSSKDGSGVFLGIISENMLDGEGIIPFLSPEREDYIEYDIARLIQGVTHISRTKIAIASSLPLETGSGGSVGVLNGTSKPYYIFQALQKDYDLIGLSDDYRELLDKKNRPKVALILHPRPLSKQANDALTTYLATGGRAIIAVDPFSEAIPLPIGSPQKNAEFYSDMPDFFKKIGLLYDNQRIILDKNHARKIVNPQNSRSDTYLAWLKLAKDNFSKQNPMMSSINELSFSTTGYLQRDASFKGTLNITPLIYSLQKADFITRNKMTQIQSLDALQAGYNEKMPYTLAMLVTGKMSLPQVKTNNTDDMAVIVVADSDFLDDRLWLQIPKTGGDALPFADNLNLMLNYVDYLAGDSALIALRGKKVIYRPLIYLENIKKSAQQKFIDQEKILQDKIETLRNNIAQINKDYAVSSGNTLPDKINAEIQRFSQELIVLRKQLREVRRNMTIDIKNSEQTIKLLNMIIVPLCFSILAMIIIAIRKSKAFRKTKGG